MNRSPFGIEDQKDEGLTSENDSEETLEEEKRTRKFQRTESMRGEETR